MEGPGLNHQRAVALARGGVRGRSSRCSDSRRVQPTGSHFLRMQKGGKDILLQDEKE